MFSFENALWSVLMVTVVVFCMHSAYNIAKMTPDAKKGIESMVLSR